MGPPAPPLLQPCRVLSTVEILMYCMTAPWGLVAPDASPRRAMRLVDLFLLIVAQRLWVADQAGSLATRPPDAISAGRAAGRGAGECAPRCTPL